MADDLVDRARSGREWPTWLTAVDRISVVVVAHNSGALLVDCVARALASNDCGELVVLDNASTDGSIAPLAAITDPRLRVVTMPGNAGFAVACNRGTALTTHPWLLFLNPDALVAPETLGALLQVMQNNADIGLLGADVRNVAGQHEAAARRRDPTILRMLATQCARWPGLSRWAAHGLEIAPSDTALSDVDAVSGALMLLPRTAFAQIGGFDEGFFLHAEDLDLCRRVRTSGNRVVVANRVPVNHVQGTSSGTRPYFVIWHKHRSLWRYFAKHEGLRAWMPRAWFLLLLLAARAAAQSTARLLRRR